MDPQSDTHGQILSQVSKLNSGMRFYMCSNSFSKIKSQKSKVIYVLWGQESDFWWEQLSHICVSSCTIVQQQAEVFVSVAMVAPVNQVWWGTDASSRRKMKGHIADNVPQNRFVHICTLTEHNINKSTKDIILDAWQWYFEWQKRRSGDPCYGFSVI